MPEVDSHSLLTAPPGSGPDSASTRAVNLRAKIFVLSAILIVFCTALASRVRETLVGPNVVATLMTAPHRPVAPRLSLPRFDRHRPLGPLGPPLSLQTLSRLDRTKDPLQAAEALLLAGERDQARQRLLHLEGEAGTRSARVSNDLAVLAILEGDVLLALRLLDRILGDEPRNSQALFNRALALQALGLRLAAARSFDQVAALAEPGWSAESAAQARRLRSESAARLDRRRAVIAAGRGLALGGRLPPPALLEGQADVMRTWFFEALRTQTSPRAVERLRPLARTLDSVRPNRGADCEQELDHVRALDFSVRAPMAQLYAILLRSGQPGDIRPGPADAILAHSEDPSVSDIVMGALVLSDDVKLGRNLDLFLRLAAASRNPELSLVEAEVRWSRANRDRDYAESERVVLAGLTHCQELPGNRRCIALEGRLARSLSLLYRIPEARARNDGALERAREFGFVGEELRLLRTAAELEGRRFREPLARAYLEELTLNPQTTCQDRRFAREMRAAIALREVRPKEAAAELALVPSCGRNWPIFTTEGLAVAAALRRFGEGLVDPAKVTASIEALSAHDRVEGRFLQQMAKGLWRLASDPAAGRGELARAIANAERLADDNDEGHYVRSESYLQLAVESARTGQWAQSLQELAAAAGTPLPRGCVLGVAVDVERAVAILRAPDGRVEGRFEQRVPEPFARQRGEETPPTLDRKIRDAIARCDEVKVLAPAKHRFWSRLFPSPATAWSYLVPPPKGSLPPVGEPGGHRLVVTDPEPPAQAGLQRLSPMAVDVSDGAQVLRGPWATPMRVRAALPSADLIELHVHGLANAEVSEYTALALSSDRDGRYLLTMSDVKGLTLPRRPIVLLAACHAARAATNRPDSSELAGAFVGAGARGVLAAVGSIPDAEADPFFARVRSGVAAGRSLAQALRDAQLSWPHRPDSWTNGVIAFE